MGNYNYEDGEVKYNLMVCDKYCKDTGLLSLHVHGFKGLAQCTYLLKKQISLSDHHDLSLT